LKVNDERYKEQNVDDIRKILTEKAIAYAKSQYGQSETTSEYFKSSHTPFETVYRSVAVASPIW